MDLPRADRSRNASSDVGMGLHGGGMSRRAEGTKLLPKSPSRERAQAWIPGESRLCRALRARLSEQPCGQQPWHGERQGWGRGLAGGGLVLTCRVE